MSSSGSRLQLHQEIAVGGAQCPVSVCVGVGGVGGVDGRGIGKEANLMRQ